MKKMALLLFLIFFCSTTYAQQMSVTSFKKLSLNSSRIYPRIRLDRDIPSIIKIPVNGNPNNFTFEVSTEIQKTHIFIDEIWVFIPKRTKKLTIIHKDFGAIKDYKFPEKIKFEGVYLLYLQMPEVDNVDEEMIIVDELPIVNGWVYPKFKKGGREGFQNWVIKRFKITKEMKQEGIAEIQGKVVVKYTIDKHGKISDCKSLLSPHQLLTNELIRVLLSAPRWKPATMRGKPVQMVGTIGIDFPL